MLVYIKLYLYICIRKTKHNLNMTTSTRTELMNIAKQAAAYITRLNGENDTFQIAGETLIAVITYEAEIGEDPGDRGTAPDWWIERETVSVEEVYNEDGENDPEAVKWLENQLN